MKRFLFNLCFALYYLILFLSSRNADAQWMQLCPTSNVSGFVSAMHRFHNKLYASYAPQYGISVFGGGTFSQIPSTYGVAYGFIEYHNELLCYGSLGTSYNTNCTPTSGNTVCWFDGVQWCSRGGIPGGGSVCTALVYKDTLYVGGSITFIDIHGNQVCGIAKWDGAHWVSPGFYLGNDIGAPVVSALCEYQNKLYIGGGFNMVNGSLFASQHIMTWDGTSYQGVGGGLNNNPFSNTSVMAFAVYHNELWIAGYFSVASGMTVNGVVRCNGTGYIAAPFISTYPTMAMAVYQSRLYLSRKHALLVSTATQMCRGNYFHVTAYRSVPEETGLFYSGGGVGVYVIYPDSVGHTLYIGGNMTHQYGGGGIDYLGYLGVIMLPIQLISFTAMATPDVPNQITLQWSTANETDNDRFVVERSLDAQIFDSVGMVSGFGTTSDIHDYTVVDHGFPDATTEKTSTYYYRLKQIDVDGAFHYSPVVSCELIQSDIQNTPTMLLYPNPASQYLVCETMDSGILSLYDIQGICVAKQETFGKRMIDLSAYDPGIYVVVFYSQGGEVFTKKCIKQ